MKVVGCDALCATIHVLRIIPVHVHHGMNESKPCIKGVHNLIGDRR